MYGLPTYFNQSASMSTINLQQGTQLVEIISVSSLLELLFIAFAVYVDGTKFKSFVDFSLLTAVLSQIAYNHQLAVQSQSNSRPSLSYFCFTAILRLQSCFKDPLIASVCRFCPHLQSNLFKGNKFNGHGCSHFVCPIPTNHCFF